MVHVAGGNEGAPALVGLVVSRAVGGAVERNQVKRRLRGLMVHEVEQLDGALVVVRALPAAAGSTSADLCADLRAALGAARSVRPGRRSSR